MNGMTDHDSILAQFLYDVSLTPLCCIGMTTGVPPYSEDSGDKCQHRYWREKTETIAFFNDFTSQINDGERGWKWFDLDLIFRGFWRLLKGKNSGVCVRVSDDTCTECFYVLGFGDVLIAPKDVWGLCEDGYFIGERREKKPRMFLEIGEETKGKISKKYEREEREAA